MLDGVGNESGHRFATATYDSLVQQRRYMNGPPSMERYVTYPEWAKVAEAILELEGLADWRPLEGGVAPEMTSELACLALDEVGHLSDRFADISEALLEAAAILRDGWRPKGWQP